MHTAPTGEAGGAVGGAGWRVRRPAGVPEDHASAASSAATTGCT